MTTNPPGKLQAPTEHNPKTQAKFKRESFWQITFPMIVVTVLMLGCLGGLLLLSGDSGVSIVSDYSLILLILPTLVAGLAALALVAGLIYLVVLGIDKLPPYAFIAQKSVFAVQQKVEGVANSITGVIIAVQAFFGGIAHYLREHGLLPEDKPSTPPAASGADAGAHKAN